MRQGQACPTMAVLSRIRSRLPSRWVVTVSAAAAATLPGDALLYTVLPVVWADLGLELWMVGILLSVNRLVRLATNPLAGWLVARLGVRGPFTAAVLASAATTAAYGLGLGFVVLLVARLGWGLCWSFIRLGGLLAALEDSAPNRRGFALGFYNGVVSIGTLVAVLFGGLLTDRIGFAPTTFGFAAIPLVAGLGMLWASPPPSRPAAGSPRPTTTGSDTPGEPAVPARRRFALYAAVAVASASGAGIAVATLGLWLVERFGDPIQLASFAVGAASLNGGLLSVRFAAAVGWAPAAGHLSDRVGRLPFLAVSGVGVVVGLLGLSMGLSLPGTVAIVVLLFLSGTALRVSLDAAAGDQAPPERRSQMMSRYATASDLGASAGPFLAYSLAGWVGLAGVYRGAAVCVLLTGLCTLPLLRPEKRRRREAEVD